LPRFDAAVAAVAAVASVLGTPREQSWPGVEAFPEFKESFPKWAPMPWSKLLVDAEPGLVDVVSVSVWLAATRCIAVSHRLLRARVCVCVLAEAVGDEPQQPPDREASAAAPLL
jgi:hypothetical protein